MTGFKKAVKKEAKLRMSIAGPSGSGKTYTALTLATKLANGGNIAVVDTEHGSASKYADAFNFDTMELDNFHPGNYVKAIKAAVDAGYSVVVLDSITHAWNGKGGILEMVGQNFGKWKDVQPIEQGFIEAIIGSPIHIIATMRAKTQYEVEKDERGKASPKKIGMGAIQRDGIEYEFDITCMMDVQNNIAVEKTRCPAMQGRIVNKPDGTFMEPIIAWLSGGAPLQEEVKTTPSFKSMDDAIDTAVNEGWFATREEAEQTYNSVKAERKPQSPDEMWALWSAYKPQERAA